MEDPQNLLESIIKAIVCYPEEVKIIKKVDKIGILYHIWVNPTDMGIVIGKRGDTASAIKLIVKIAGYKTNSHIAIKIEEPSKEIYETKQKTKTI